MRTREGLKILIVDENGQSSKSTLNVVYKEVWVNSVLPPCNIVIFGLPLVILFFLDFIIVI